MSSFFQVECHSLKPMLQQDVCRHAPYGEKESSENYQYMNTDVGLQKKAGTYTSSSPQEGKKYGHVKKHLRYNSSHSQVDYVYVKHGKYACIKERNSCCSYCGMCNHDISKCWNRLKAYRKQLRQRKLAKKVQRTCTHCQKEGHFVSQCWTLHPTNYPKHMRQEDRKTYESGTKDSIIDVRTNVSHEV